MANSPQQRPAQMGEVFAGFEPYSEPNRRRRVLLIGGTILALFFVYVMVAWGLSGSVPKGVSVGGVNIASMQPSEAVKKLQQELGNKQNAALKLKVGEKEAEIIPAQAGLSVDYQATVDALTNFSLSPRLIWGHLFGLGEQSAVSKVDAGKLKAALQAVAPQLQTAPIEANLICEGNKFKPVEPQNGLDLNQSEAQEFLANNWATQPQPIVLPHTETSPKTTAAHLDQMEDGVAATLLSAPVRASLDGAEAEISVAQLCQVASFKPSEKGLELHLDGKALHDIITKAIPDKEVTPQNATFAFNPNYFAKQVPTVVPSRDGKELKPEDLAEAIKAAAISPDQREAGLKLSTLAPEFTTEDAEHAGIKEIIGEFETPAPYHPIRTFNLDKGSHLITGKLIKPGGEFSLLKSLGPIELENGWKDAGVIQGIFHKNSAGGGLSQLSTTTYNAAFFAGMDLLEHTPHSEYYTRYPAGRESTLWDPEIDLKWRNSTPTYVLVEAHTTDNAQFVRLWGTKYWDVKESTGPRTNVVAPTTIRSLDPHCAPSGPGTSGFTVTVHRERWREGKKHDSEDWTVTYRPQNHIVCGPEPKETPKPTESNQSKPPKD